MRGFNQGTNICLIVLKALNHSEPAARKSSVQAIVQLYRIVGDSVWNNLKTVSPVHKKLIFVYIDKAIIDRN